MRHPDIGTTMTFTVPMGADMKLSDETTVQPIMSSVRERTQGKACGRLKTGQ